MDFLLLNPCILLIVRIRIAKTQDFLQSFIDTWTVCLDYIFLRRRGNIVFWIWNSPLLTYFCILQEKWVFYYSIILGMANLLSLLVEDSHLSKGFQFAFIFFENLVFFSLCYLSNFQKLSRHTYTHNAFFPVFLLFSLLMEIHYLKYSIHFNITIHFGEFFLSVHKEQPHTYNLHIW